MRTQGTVWARVASAALGGIAALLALSAAGYAFAIYLVEGTNGVANPYAARVGFGLAALALALVVAVGAILVYARPLLGGLLMMGGGVLGAAAIVLFNINTWYPLGVPLCLLAALLAAASAPRRPASLALAGLALALLLAATVTGYVFAGIAIAVICAALFVVALALFSLTQARPAGS